MRSLDAQNSEPSKPMDQDMLENTFRRLQHVITCYNYNKSSYLVTSLVVIFSHQETWEFQPGDVPMIRSWPGQVDVPELSEMQLQYWFGIRARLGPQLIIQCVFLIPWSMPMDSPIPIL